MNRSSRRPGDHFLIIDCSVEVSAGSEARVVGTLKTGEVFGGMSLIERGPRSAAFKATGNTRCIVTNYDEVIAPVQDHPQRAVEFIKTLLAAYVRRMSASRR